MLLLITLYTERGLLLGTEGLGDFVIDLWGGSYFSLLCLLGAPGPLACLLKELRTLSVLQSCVLRGLQDVL